MASESPENPPKRWKWRLEWLVQTALEKLAGWLPGPLVFRMGEALGEVAWHFMKSRRQIVLRNLRIALAGERSLPELRSMTRQVFRRTGANLFSALHTTGLSADHVAEIVSVENGRLVEEALTRGPGLVLLPPHMGNWEILTRIHRLLPPGHANGAFYRPLNNPLLDERVLAQRAAQGCRLFSKRDSFHQATGFLRDGGILGILADQRVGRSGERVEFFGRLTRASPLPALLARRSRVGALALSLVTEAPGKWRIRYHAPDTPLSTATCMAAIERAIRECPLDYFWLQERWKVYISPTRTIREWLGEDGKTGAKPHRAVLWLPGAPAGWEIPTEWTHPDVIYETVNAAENDLEGQLESLDAAAALPVDFILACHAPRALVKAARSLSIPLVSLAP